MNTNRQKLMEEFYRQRLPQDQADIVTNEPSKRRRHQMFLYFTQGGVCRRCGGRENLTIDHIIPKSVTKKRSGSDLLNKQILCAKCNWEKDNPPRAEYSFMGMASFLQNLSRS